MFPALFSNKSYGTQFAYLILFILGGITIFTSLALLIGQIFNLEAGSRIYLYVAQSISALGVFMVPALLFSYCSTKNCFSFSDANKKVEAKWIGYVMLLSIIILPLIAGFVYVNEQIKFPASLHNIEVWMREMEEKNNILTQTLTAHSTISILLVNIVIMAVFPALFEEFLFRGTLQPFFTQWFHNKHLAIILTAFIFSSIHFQFFGFIPRFLLGIYLGYLLTWKKTLWLPITAHFCHNALSLILDYCKQQGFYAY